MGGSVNARLVSKYLKMVPLVAAIATLAFEREAHAVPAYCQGTITDVIVYSTSTGAAIDVRHSGSHPTNWMRVETASSEEVKTRTLTLLMAAYLSGRTIELKFASGTCGAIPDSTQFSYARVLP
jgi:hypothetical protein